MQLVIWIRMSNLAEIIVYHVELLMKKNVKKLLVVSKTMKKAKINFRYRNAKIKSENRFKNSF